MSLLDFIHLFNTDNNSTSQTRITYLYPTYDIESRRFRYQRGRVGDKAKKHKSPAKCGRVGISAVL